MTKLSYAAALLHTCARATSLHTYRTARACLLPRANEEGARLNRRRREQYLNVGDIEECDVIDMRKRKRQAGACRFNATLASKKKKKAAYLSTLYHRTSWRVCKITVNITVTYRVKRRTRI